MAFTTHGHQIIGSPVEGDPVNVARCGGVGICNTCSKESLIWRSKNAQEPSGGIGGAILTEIARDIAYTHIVSRRAPDEVRITPADIHIVWFSKVLQNWKALVVTQLPDGRYYELTHNGNTGETYIDTYVKTSNDVVPYNQKEPT